MGRYKKLPVEIEAVQLGSHTLMGPMGVPTNLFNEEAPPWIIDSLNNGDLTTSVSQSGFIILRIRTSEGEMIASPEDWIIRGVKGELYPCKPDIFDITYEKVENVD